MTRGGTKTTRNACNAVRLVAGKHQVEAQASVSWCSRPVPSAFAAENECGSGRDRNGRDRDARQTLSVLRRHGSLDMSRSTLWRAMHEDLLSLLSLLPLHSLLSLFSVYSLSVSLSPLSLLSSHMIISISIFHLSSSYHHSSSPFLQFHPFQRRFHFLRLIRPELIFFTQCLGNFHVI